MAFLFFSFVFFFLILLYFLHCRELVRLYFGKLKTAIFENCSLFKISCLGSSFFIRQICGYVKSSVCLYQSILSVGIDIDIVRIFVKIKFLSNRINKTNLGTGIGCTTQLPNINSIYG
jgi:hypothetical protein